MTLKEKIKEYTEVQDEIKLLYKKKNAIEKLIIEEMDKIDPDTNEKKTEVDVNDYWKLALIYENKIDPVLVRELYPRIFDSGQRLYFSWSKAILTFENEKDFWRLMKDCRVKTPKLKKVRKNGTRTKKGT